MRKNHLTTTVRSRILIGLTVLLLSMFQFHKIYFSKFSLVVGNLGDSRFLTITLENWYQSLLGSSHWLNSPFFYPAPRVLSFSDPLFLYVPMYVPFRLLGLDPLFSFQISFLLLVSFGYLGMIALCKKLGLDLFESLLLGGILTLSNGMTMASGHGQLALVQLLPWLLLSAINSLSAKDKRIRVAYAFMTGIFIAALFFTSFYIAWFAVLTTSAFLMIWSLLNLKKANKQFAKHTREFLFFIFGFGIGLLPFAYTYLPLIRKQIERDFSEVSVYLLFKEDLLNLGADNLIWGKLIGLSTQSNFAHQSSEFMMSPTPLLIVLATIMSLLVVKRSRLPFVLLLTLTATYALTFFIGTQTPWRFIFDFVPGASAIRAVGRLGLVINFGIILVLAVSLLLARELTKQSQLARRSISVLLVIVFLEQINSGLELGIDRRDARTWPSADISKSECSTFFIKPDINRAGFASNLDAMAMSLDSGVPTINGYSGLFPDQWNLLDTNSPTYYENVEHWISINGLTNVCEVEPDGSSWSQFSFSKE
jgi:hypothetical protein